MDIAKRKADLTQEFNNLKAEEARIRALLESIGQRLFQLQGKFEMLSELEQETGIQPIEVPAWPLPDGTEDLPKVDDEPIVVAG